MGWFIDGTPSITCYADEKARIEELCTGSGEGRSIKLLRCSKVGSVWYAAVQASLTDKIAPDERTFKIDDQNQYVFGAVFLTRYDDGCWGYKSIDETMGPVEARAPMSIINLLSELIDPDCYAHKWRESCRAWADIPKYAEGDTIELPNPIPMQSGISVKTVVATHYMRRGRKMRCYKDVKTGSLVRLSKNCFVGSMLIKTAATSGSAILEEFYEMQDR